MSALHQPQLTIITDWPPLTLLWRQQIGKNIEQNKQIYKISLYSVTDIATVVFREKFKESEQNKIKCIIIHFQSCLINFVANWHRQNISAAIRSKPPGICFPVQLNVSFSLKIIEKKIYIDKNPFQYFCYITRLIRMLHLCKVSKWEYCYSCEANQQI